MKTERPRIFATIGLLVAGVVSCTAAPSDIIRTDASGTGGTSVPGSGGNGGSTPASGGSSGSGGSIGSGGSGGGASDAPLDTPAAETIEPGNGALCTAVGDKFDCNNVLMGMDGYFNNDVPNGPAQGSDGIQLNCTTGAAKPYKEKHWQLTGPGITMGKMYKVAMHFYGVVECKTYVGGTGPAKTDPNMTPNVSQTHNLWTVGARDNGNIWNTYAFTVTPASSSVLVGIGPQTAPLPTSDNTYVINQCPGTAGEAHFTWRLDFDSTINVPGGSFINYIEYDTNCRFIVNCGAADAAQSCAGPYNIMDAVKNAVPNTNASFTQPPANASNPPARSQWWLVDVANVTAL